MQPNRKKTARTVVDLPSINVATSQTEVDRQAAKFRCAVARAAMAGIKKGETVPLQLFEQVWQEYFMPNHRELQRNESLILHKQN